MRTQQNLFIAGILSAFIALSPSLRAQNGFNGPGWYRITNVKSGKVLTMDTALDTSGNAIVSQYGPMSGENQIWVLDPAPGGYFFVRNATNGNTLEPTGPNNSSIVLAAPFRSTQNQMWRFERGKDGNAIIRNYWGKVLDLPDGSSNDGVRMQIYDLNGDSNQRYVLQKVSGDFGRGWRGGGPPPALMTCSSDDGHRKYCDADTRGGVRLTRQISGSPCRQNDTWGFDRRGVWVDRGCRAEFQVGR